MCNQRLERAPIGIRWNDLQPMSRADTVRELLLPLPWLLASLGLYATSLWPLGFASAFMFFLCGLRLNHEAIHGNLGLSRQGDFIVLHLLSFLMLGSNHAVAHGHMLHHKHAMGPEDFEGRCGDMRLGAVLVYGPRFPVDILRAAWGSGRRALRRRVAVDIGLNLTLAAIAVWVGGVMLFHLAAMVVAQCLTALFAVWITHRGASERGVVARSQRGILAKAAYLMFYHREHHLFPRVPVHRLPILAERLDRGVPGYAAARLPVVPFLEPREA